MSCGPSLPEFDGLDLGDRGVFDGESEDRSHGVKPLVPASSRVHVQEVRGGVAHHSQDMGMSSEEERWLCSGDFFPGVLGVIAILALALPTSDRLCHRGNR